MQDFDWHILKTFHKSPEELSSEEVNRLFLLFSENWGLEAAIALSEELMKSEIIADEVASGLWEAAKGVNRHKDCIPYLEELFSNNPRNAVVAVRLAQALGSVGSLEKLDSLASEIVETISLGPWATKTLATLLVDSLLFESSRKFIRKLPESKTRTLLENRIESCLLYTSPSPRDRQKSRMPSSA